MTLRRLLFVLGLFFAGLGILFLKIALTPASQIQTVLYTGLVEAAASTAYGRRGDAFMVRLDGTEGSFLVLDHLERRPGAVERLTETFAPGRGIEIRVYPLLPENRGPVDAPHETIEARAEGRVIFARSDWVEDDNLLRWVFGLFGALFAVAGGYLMLRIVLARRRSSGGGARTA